MVCDTPVSTYVTKSVSIITDKSLLSSSCKSNGGIYESTRVRKMVVFDHGNSAVATPIDVSNTIYDIGITIPTPGTPIAQINDLFYVSGKSAGTADIEAIPIIQDTGIVYTKASITVSEDISASNSDINMATMQYVDWTNGNTAPRIIDQIPLTAEGDWQIIFPVFNPSGIILTKSQNDELLQDIVSTNTNIYEITQHSSPGAYRFWRGTVAHGAISEGGTGVIMLNTLSDTSTCTFSQAFTDISLPSIVSVLISMPDPIVAIAGDPSEDTYKKSTNDGIIVTVLFSDDTSVVYTRDSRTNWLFVNNPHGATISPINTDQVRFTAPGSVAAHTVELKAEVMGISSNTLSIALVTATGISASVQSIEGRSSGTQSTILKRVHCASDIYQGLQIVARLIISNGDNVISSLVTNTISGTGALRKITNTNHMFVGYSPGQEFIETTYGTLTTSTLVTVSTDSVFFSSVVVRHSVYSHLKESTSLLSIELTFRDGEHIADGLSNFYGYSIEDILNDNTGLFKIESDEESSIAVLPSGRIQLLSNSEHLVNISIIPSTCAGHPYGPVEGNWQGIGTLAIYANIVPGNYYPTPTPKPYP